MTEPLLQVEHLSAGYQQRGKAPHVVVQPFTRSLPPGKLTCLIGPNGAGKSTLLRTIAGMQPPLTGQALLAGQDVHQMNARERARRLSVVLTQQMEVSLFSGYELVAMGRHPYTAWTGQLSTHDHQVIRQSIEMVGAENLSARAFTAMSDGERQKIMIARALAQEPDLLVLDEPTAFLDLPRRVECLTLLRDLARRTGRTILLSTHDLELALRLADHLWLLPYSGELCAGAPEDLVMSGAFEAAFRSTKVSFDMETGAFHSDSHATERIVLEGSGIPYLWTRRALEREGFIVLAKREPAVPVIRLQDAAEQHWELISGSNATLCHSIDELMTTLKPYK